MFARLCTPSPPQACCPCRLFLRNCPRRFLRVTFTLLWPRANFHLDFHLATPPEPRFFSILVRPRRWWSKDNPVPAANAHLVGPTCPPRWLRRQLPRRPPRSLPFLPVVVAAANRAALGATATATATEAVATGAVVPALVATPRRHHRHHRRRPRQQGGFLRQAARGENPATATAAVVAAAAAAAAAANLP